MHIDAHKPWYKDSREALVSKSIGQLSLTKKLHPGNLVIAIAGELFDGRSSLSRPTIWFLRIFNPTRFTSATEFGRAGPGAPPIVVDQSARSQQPCCS